jgi:ribosomal-protein-serine acetyltransferase
VFSLVIDHALQLRQLEGHQAPLLFALTEKNRAYLRRWLFWLDDNTTAEDSRSFIDSGRERYANRESLELGIWHREALVGMVGFNHFAWGAQSGELGYWLDAEAQGTGIMTRSCRGLIAHAFAELDLHRVEIRCAADNQRSRAIPERLGFRQEGQLRQVEWLYDHFVDHCVYGLLAGEELR